MNDINSLSLEVLCDDEVPTLSVPPITAIDPRPNHDDEVSALSFMGDSDLAQDRCVPPSPDHRGKRRHPTPRRDGYRRPGSPPIRDRA